MALTSTRVLIERAPQNGCHPCLCTQGELQLLPASLGHSLRSAGGSDPGFFQITDSTMGLEVCNIWHSFFESRVCSVEPSDPPYARSTVLQIQTFWGLIFQV